MADKKICPLLVISCGSGGDSFPVHCKEENCAWWDNSNNECAIKSITSLLHEISEIKEYM